MSITSNIHDPIYGPLTNAPGGADSEAKANSDLEEPITNDFAGLIAWMQEPNTNRAIEFDWSTARMHDDPILPKVWCFDHTLGVGKFMRQASEWNGEVLKEETIIRSMRSNAKAMGFSEKEIDEIVVNWRAKFKGSAKW